MIFAQLRYRLANMLMPGKPGDWMKDEDTRKPAAVSRPFASEKAAPAYDPEEIFKEFAIKDGEKTRVEEAMQAIAEGKAEVVDATLFMGRFNGYGRMNRKTGAKESKPYQVRRVTDAAKFKEAMTAAKNKIRESFTSSSDLGSTYQMDPNQYTEYTPYFGGPFAKQQYWDQFKALARAFEEWNHNPIAKRLVNILVQYAVGRGLTVTNKNDEVQKKWDAFAQEHKLYYKLRKFWVREYLIYGELMIDVVDWISVDPSTIWDIVCEGVGEFIDSVLYYQQMFQTATQTYAGQSVPGVPGSAASSSGKYIIRQIPYDRIIHIKTECVSNEKRGRSVLYAILGWCKRIKDLYNAQVLGEQLKASICFDDTITGSDADVTAHAAKYNYMPVAPTIFVHNEAVKRQAIAPMSGVTAGRQDIGQEILAMIATCIGIPKEHLNVSSQGGGGRATALVGSEPFTKVIEDLQQDIDDLLKRVQQEFCAQNKIDYVAEDWKNDFPSVTKDSTKEVLENIALAKAEGVYSPRTAANKIATELEEDNYDYDAEVAQAKKDAEAGLTIAMTPPVPAGRFGFEPPQPQPDETDPAASQGPSPIHGDGRKKLMAKLRSI